MEKFNLNELYKAFENDSFQGAEFYCKNKLKFLNAGSSRSAYLLSPKRVLKLANCRDGIKHNCKENMIYKKINKNYKSKLAKIFYVHPSGLFLIVEKLEKLDGNEFPIFPHQIPYKLEKEINLTAIQVRKFRKLKSLISLLEKKYKVCDFENPANWMKRKNGSIVTCDYSYPL